MGNTVNSLKSTFNKLKKLLSGSLPQGRQFFDKLSKIDELTKDLWFPVIKLNTSDNNGSSTN